MTPLQSSALGGDQLMRKSRDVTDDAIKFNGGPCGISSSVVIVSAELGVL